MNKPKLKWVPDIHRPTTDFSAEHKKSGLRFHVMTYNGVGVLTVKMPLPARDGVKRWMIEETRYQALGLQRSQLAMDAAEEYLK